MGRILDRLRGYSVVWFGFDPLPSRGIIEFKGAAVTSVVDDKLNERTVVTIDGPGAVAGVSSVSATAPITSTGGATPVIGISAASPSAAGSMSAADKTKLNSLTAGAAVASVSGTAPIQSTGGTTPTISIDLATTTSDGAMAASDKVLLNGLAEEVELLVGSTGYASIRITGTTTAQTVGTTPAVVTGWTSDGAAVHATPAHGSGTITIGADGVYVLSYSVSWVGSTGAVYTVSPYVDGTALVGGASTLTFVTTGSRVHLSSSCPPVVLTAGQVIDLRASANGSTKDFALNEGHLSVVRVD